MGHRYELYRRGRFILYILMERAKSTSACMGMEGYDAELVLKDVVDGEPVTYYIHADGYEMVHYFFVFTKSVFDYRTNLSDVDPGEPDAIEEYEGLEEAKDSRFYKYFLIAERLLQDILPSGSDEVEVFLD